jgi:hypothetical protein
VQLRPGSRLRSTVCETEVVVVRAPDGQDVDLSCGGAPMVATSDPPGQANEPAPALAGGTAIGKRYASEPHDVEVLATKSGQGTLTIGSEVLELKLSKALPASD